MAHVMNGRTRARTDSPKPICPLTIFEVGGITRAGVCKALCPQHLLAPTYDQIYNAVFLQNILDFAQKLNR